jgi:hypothetical protein
MNPFEKFLQAIFGVQSLPKPTANYPQYSGEPTTKPEDVTKEAWQERLNSSLTDSLASLSPKFQPEFKLSDLRETGPLGYVGWTSEDRVSPKEMAFNTNPNAWQSRYQSADPEADMALAQYRQAPASLVNPRQVQIHEFGHLANSRVGGAFPAESETAKVFNSNYADALFSKPQFSSLLYSLRDASKQSGPEFKAAASIDPYYRTEPREAFAQAFVNAWEFLAETARDPKMDYRKFAGDLESNTPGMGMIIRDLLKDKIFKAHPLRGKIFTEGENARTSKPRTK